MSKAMRADVRAHCPHGMFAVVTGSFVNFLYAYSRVLDRRFDAFDENRVSKCSFQLSVLVSFKTHRRLRGWRTQLNRALEYPVSPVL